METKVKAQITPGPWHMERENTYVPAQVFRDKQLIANVYGDSYDEREANARAIAALPELIEAAQFAYRRALQTDHRDDELIYALADALRKAGVL